MPRAPWSESYQRFGAWANGAEGRRRQVRLTAGLRSDDREPEDPLLDQATARLGESGQHSVVHGPTKTLRLSGRWRGCIGRPTTSTPSTGFRVVVFPVVTGSSGRERIYDGWPDVARDGRADRSVTLLGAPRVLTVAPDADGRVAWRRSSIMAARQRRAARRTHRRNAA